MTDWMFLLPFTACVFFYWSLFSWKALISVLFWRMCCTEDQCNFDSLAISLRGVSSGFVLIWQDMFLHCNSICWNYFGPWPSTALLFWDEPVFTSFSVNLLIVQRFQFLTTEFSYNSHLSPTCLHKQSFNYCLLSIT